MKISINWLKTLLKTDLGTEDIAARLTAAGLEVEGIEQFESIKGGLKGLVTGLVTACEKHPDADRLSVTKVDIGTGEALNIVCGAPNVATGQKVIVATVGTTLYPSGGEALVIKKSKIRGVPSEGMICAEDEIGIGNSHAGILVLPEDTAIGLPASDYFKIENDTVLEIGLTPNRSDAASHLGVARDLAAILNSQEPHERLQLQIPGLYPLPDSTGLRKIDIEIKNPEACKRYAGLVISGIRVKESPDWIKQRLLAIGVRPINNVVDITNFVLHELGQPLHAFDADAISGNRIVVRTAKANETFKTLDGVERKLSETDLMICNEKTPMCLAGIFGGADSGVNENTTSVFLESAYFDPGFIRRSAKHHALKTDASFRFERGTDPDMCLQALNRAANLIIELAGGNISMDSVDVYPQALEAHKVAFSYSNCNELIGKEVDRHKIRSILVNLGIEIISEGADGLLLHVPFYKHDVTREADVVEEVMRIYGYDNIEPGKEIHYTAYNESPNPHLLLENKCASALEAFGFNEIMSLSLSNEKYYDEKTSLVKLLNPLSQELNVLRADSLFSGLECIAYNLNRKNNNLKLFEIGKTYKTIGEGQYEEEKSLSLFVTGQLFNDNPYGLKQKSDFSYLKACVDALLEKCGVYNHNLSEVKAANFQYGLEYLQGTKLLVQFGKVAKTHIKACDLSQDVYYANFKWDVLAKAFSKRKIEFSELSRFPSVRRDLALLLDKKIQFKDVKDLAFTTEKKWLETVNIFDIYEDEKLGNKKSYALSFTLLNKDATLTDAQIEGVMNKLIGAYKDKLGAELR
ncbi:MAG: phenylalanine--tRNA ligase subunit beta [Bacteroidia bacterium]|nr:phenylalanine--tRNA ligase subunit beta [Bacteroidia bacterium]